MDLEVGGSIPLTRPFRHANQVDAEAVAHAVAFVGRGIAKDHAAASLTKLEMAAPLVLRNVLMSPALLSPT